MPPERTAETYGPGVTAASKAVLLELAAALRAYEDALVLVGGWVPYFLLEAHRPSGDPFVHVGSIDIDIAVDPERVNDPAYATIVELLRARGYRPAAGQRGGPPASLERTVPSPVTHKPYTIRVDFLAPGAQARGRREPPLVIQDGLTARKLKGCEAAFRHHTAVPLSGPLPDGGTMTVPIRMADVVGCLTMKGIVLGERYREKDAYDLYALLAHYGRGPAGAAEAVRPHREEPLVGEALASIHAAFSRRDAHGPAWVAAFLVQPVFRAERERVITDAFMTVQEFLRLVAEPSPRCSPR